MRKLWMSLILLSVSLVALVAPMYVQGDSGAADDTTKTQTKTAATATDTEVETSSTSETGPTYGFILKVDPPSHTIRHLKNGKDGSAAYSVSVKALSGFRGEVQLSIKGLPEESEALFNPDEGVPKPVFVSALKIAVEPSTPSGIYTLTIYGSSGDTTQLVTTTLVIEGEATPLTTSTVENELKVSVSTDQGNYERGDKVGISGYVKLSSGASLAGATISLNVLDPSGKEVHGAVTETNQAGRYSENFTLASSMVEGTYTAYATANMTGYKDSFATATFTVGVSVLPSVRIVNATITMLNGTASSEFHPGETVVVWAAVNNTGAELTDGNMWVEVLDPDKSPITLVVVVVTIHTGEQAKIGVHVILASSAKLGTYAVEILVSDLPIMKGGKFLDITEMAFIVTSETSITTTTTHVTTETTSTSTTQTTSTSTSATEATSTSQSGSTSTSTTESTSTTTTQTAETSSTTTTETT